MTGGNFLTRHTGRATPALGTAARNALGPQSRPLRKRLAFLNASWFDSQNFCFARLNVTCGNSPDSSRNDRLGHNDTQQFFFTKVQATTQKAPVPKRVVRFANFVCWTEVRIG